jgi:hypothetical protein
MVQALLWTVTLLSWMVLGVALTKAAIRRVRKSGEQRE